MSFLLNHKAKKSVSVNNGGNPLTSRFARQTNKQQVSFPRKGGSGGQVQVQEKRLIQTKQQTVQQRQTKEQKVQGAISMEERKISNAIDNESQSSSSSYTLVFSSSLSIHSKQS